MERIKKGSWTDFKDIVLAKEMAFQFEETTIWYDLFAVDVNITYIFRLKKTTPPSDDQVDWESNFMGDANQGIQSAENPAHVSVGFPKKKDKTVHGNNVECPTGSSTTLCTRTVKAGKNMLIECVIVSKDDPILATVTVKNVTDSKTERKYWMDKHTMFIPDRIFIKNENGTTDIDISLILKQSSGATIKATGVLVAVRTK